MEGVWPSSDEPAITSSLLRILHNTVNDSPRIRRNEESQWTRTDLLFQRHSAPLHPPQTMTSCFALLPHETVLPIGVIWPSSWSITTEMLRRRGRAWICYLCSVLMRFLRMTSLRTAFLRIAPHMEWVRFIYTVTTYICIRTLSSLRAYQLLSTKYVIRHNDHCRYCDALVLYILTYYIR